MATAVRNKLEDRVANAAEAVLAERRLVTAIDVLVGIRWLTTSQVDRWRQGRVEYLESRSQQASPTFRPPCPPSAIGPGSRA